MQMNECMLASMVVAGAFVGFPLTLWAIHRLPNFKFSFRWMKRPLLVPAEVVATFVVAGFMFGVGLFSWQVEITPCLAEPSDEKDGDMVEVSWMASAEITNPCPYNFFN